MTSILSLKIQISSSFDDQNEAVTSTTPDLELLQRILPMEDLREIWEQKPYIFRIGGTRGTSLSINRVSYIVQNKWYKTLVDRMMSWALKFANQSVEISRFAL